MDLYRYFHPHHNPRLRSVPLRLQELGELEQAAAELRRAVKRAEIRTEPGNSIGGIEKVHFSQILQAMDYVAESLRTLAQAHPGDDLSSTIDILNEREEAPGWETWVRLLKQRLDLTDPLPLPFNDTNLKDGT